MAEYRRVNAVLKGIKSGRDRGVDGRGLPAPVGPLWVRDSRKHSFALRRPVTLESRLDYGGQQD